MPISCPGKQKPRYRVTTTKGGQKRRLAFCGDRVVENTLMVKNKKGKLRAKATG